jgi:peroxiredoxin
MKNALRWAVIVVVVVVAAFAYVRLAEDKGYGLKKGTEAPGFRLPSLAGGEVNLASQRGKVVVLNFWATWCPPCVAEMPSLERLHRTLSPDGLSVIAVSTDEDQADVREFVSRHGLTLPVLMDPGGRVAGGEYHTTGYPETFLLDRQGRIVRHVVGPEEWDSPEMLAELRKLMASGPPS